MTALISILLEMPKGDAMSSSGFSIGTTWDTRICKEKNFIRRIQVQPHGTRTKRRAFSTLLRRPGLRASNGGVLATTRTQNVSEYMLVLALCLVAFSVLTLLVGRQEGIRPVKKWGDGGDGHWLVRMEWRPAGWSVCLPVLICPCTIKSRSSLLAPAHPGGPGKRAVKRLWCG